MRQDDPFWEEAAEAPRPARRRLRGKFPRQPRPRKKLSQILDEIAGDAGRERVSIADLVRSMHGRAFGALLLIFAFPNALPAIPGTSGILGMPLLFLAAQMSLGKQPWLPRFISERSMARADFAALVEKVNPWLAWADRFTAPRLQVLVEPFAEKLIGVVCLILSTVLVLPVPFGNMLPGIAICLIALGILERDGLWITGGVLTGIVALFVASSVIYALARGAWMLLSSAFAA